jgi:hypothetical protein
LNLVIAFLLRESIWSRNLGGLAFALTAQVLHYGGKQNGWLSH